MQGKSGSYLTVYATMVTAGLITMSNIIPETLILDTCRITRARIEFGCIVDRIAVLTHATAFVSSNPSSQKRAALSSLSLFLVDDFFPDLDTEEAFAAWLSGAGDSDRLKEEEEGSGSNSNDIILVAAVLKKGVLKEDPVRKLM